MGGFATAKGQFHPTSGIRSLDATKQHRLANQHVHVKQHGHFFFHHQQLVMAKLY